MINEIALICKLLVNLVAINAAGERSFSSATRLKTWLWLKTTSAKFSNLTVFNIHKQRTGKLRLIAVANEFVAWE